MLSMVRAHAGLPPPGKSERSSRRVREREHFTFKYAPSWPRKWSPVDLHVLVIFLGCLLVQASCQLLSME